MHIYKWKCVQCLRCFRFHHSFSIQQSLQVYCILETIFLLNLLKRFEVIVLYSFIFFSSLSLSFCISLLSAPFHSVNHGARVQYLPESDLWSTKLFFSVFRFYLTVTLQFVFFIRIYYMYIGPINDSNQKQVRSSKSRTKQVQTQFRIEAHFLPATPSIHFHLANSIRMDNKELERSKGNEKELKINFQMQATLSCRKLFFFSPFFQTK